LRNFPIEPFGPQHDRLNFRCGNEALDRYFHERIRREVEAKVAAAFVMADGPAVLCYYTLSAHSIERRALPEDVVKKLKLPKYPLIPATLMGRLAVDLKYQGQRIGEILLMDGLERSYIHSSQVASFAVVVDAKENAVEFYRRYGFLQLPAGLRMFIPMETIKKLIGFPLRRAAVRRLRGVSGCMGRSCPSLGA
jgi:GNAT superfamily N-acetyltransferase